MKASDQEDRFMDMIREYIYDPARYLNDDNADKKILKALRELTTQASTASDTLKQNQ